MALKGVGVSEFVKKRRFVPKIYSSDNVEWSSKSFWKMISAGVKFMHIAPKYTLSYLFNTFFKQLLWMLYVQAIIAFQTELLLALNYLLNCILVTA